MTRIDDRRAPISASGDVAVPAMFETRWGFVPCDRPTYQRLGRLNALVERTRRLAAGQHRFDLKTVHQGARWERIRDAGGRPIGWRRHENAVLRPVCPVLYKLRYTFAGGRGYVVDTGLEWTADLYRRARTPRPAADVTPIDPVMLTRAMEALAALETWFAKLE